MDLEAFRRFWGSPLGGLIKLAIGLSVLGYVVSTLDWSVLKALSSRAKVPHLILIVVVAVAGHVLGALRFKLLADPVLRISLFEHLRQYFIGGYFSLFLPSSMGGDGVRIVLLKAAGSTTAAGASLIATERLLGAMSLLIVSAGSGLFAPPLPWSLRLALVVAAAGALGALLVMRAVSARVTPSFAPLARALEAARAAVGHGRLLSALLLSVAYQAATVLVTVIVNHVLDLGVDDATVLALSPLVWFATLLPISVGGLGVREAAFVVVFGWGHVEREPALLLSLGTYAGLAAVGMTGALWFTWDRVRGATRPRTDTSDPQ